MKNKASKNLYPHISTNQLTPNTKALKTRNLCSIKEYQKAEREGFCEDVVMMVELAGLDDFNNQQYHDTYMNITD